MKCKKRRASARVVRLAVPKLLERKRMMVCEDFRPFQMKIFTKMSCRIWDFNVTVLFHFVQMINDDTPLDALVRENLSDKISYQYY